MSVDTQTITELEFDAVKDLLSNRCTSATAIKNAKSITPFSDPKTLENELNMLQELYDILYIDELNFPSLHFTELDREFDILRIEGGVLTLDQIINVLTLGLTTLDLIKFTRKQKDTYPLLYEATEYIENIEYIIESIDSKLEKRRRIKDSASHNLEKVRQQIVSTRREVNRNFDNALRKYKKDEIISDIEEAFRDNRRLLCVLSSHKKRVAGRSFGTSAGGSLTYIEPVENKKLNEQLENLHIEERSEIQKILAKISHQIRGERQHIKAFQRLIVRFDLLKAKAVFAKDLNAVKPIYEFSQQMELIDAKHPLLYMQNKSSEHPTLGQDVILNKENRFLVISGPNAGGKSITLKTIGLLQVMFQAGLFITVNEDSKLGWFDKILSDIGDNQSIENRLSTYSYRLHRMNFFLEETDSKTLILLDEFGSGSDPELGGALAEVLFERLYARNCYAVITTHYANIKMLTASLPEAVNACMLFDTENLEPLYKLSIGQPGSSFTFEVAELNKMPMDIITEAKGRVSKNKVKIDSLTVDLQKKKSEYEQLNKSQRKSEKQANHVLREYEAKIEKIQFQAKKQELYFEQNNKFITTGKKIFDYIKKYKKHKNNKDLNAAVTKYVAMEKTKVLEADNPIVFQPDLQPSKMFKDQVEKLKESKKTLKQAEEIVKPKKEIKLGSKVSLLNSSQSGIVKEIKRKKASVLVGNFLIDVNLTDLEAI